MAIGSAAAPQLLLLLLLGTAVAESPPPPLDAAESGGGGGSIETGFESCLGSCDQDLGVCSCEFSCVAAQTCCDDYFSVCEITPEELTCVGFCDSIAVGGCFCDLICTHYNDCCPDAASVCFSALPPAPPQPVAASSCQGFCLGAAPAGCYCDHLCTVYGDCCADAEELCLEEVTPPDMPPPVILSYGTPTVSPPDSANPGTIIVPLLYNSNVTIIGFQLFYIGPAPLAIVGGAAGNAGFAILLGEFILGAAADAQHVLPPESGSAVLFNLVFNSSLATSSMPMASVTMGGDAPGGSENETDFEGESPPPEPLSDSNAMPQQFCIVDSGVIQVTTGLTSTEMFAGEDPCVSLSVALLVEPEGCPGQGTGNLVGTEDVLDVLDIIHLVELILTNPPEAGTCVFLTADVTGDGSVNIVDAVFISNSILGLN